MWIMKILTFCFSCYRECFWERTVQPETFSWQWDSSALGSTNLLQEEDGHWRHSLWSWSCHFGKKPLWPGLLDLMLYMQDPQKNDCWSCLNKVRQFSRVPASWKSLPDILQEQKKVTNCQYRWNYVWNLLLHEKVCQILWACRLKMDAPMMQKNFRQLSGSEMSLSILEF